MKKYNAWVETLRDDKIFCQALSILEKVKGKRVLLYSHDDPDGLTAALIVEHILKKQGAKRVVTQLPPTFELEESRVAADAKKYKPQLMIICDKGTMGYYDQMLKSVPEILVIDHHWRQGEVKKTVTYNPGAWCCTAFLAHNLATALGHRDAGLDFLALIGLKGDWALEPVTKTVSPYVIPFLDELAKPWKNWLKPIKDRCTWFDVNQRSKTCLLSQVAELYSALCGNGFQYYYNDREAALRKIDQPVFTMKALAAAAKKTAKLQSCRKLTEVIAAQPAAATVKKLWNYYLQDWEMVEHQLDSALPVVKLGQNQIYLFVGNNIPLAPMIGSVKLYQLTQKTKGAGALIMGNILANGSTHFSFRGNSGEVHLGKMADRLVKRLLRRYGQKHKDIITGGGHPFAAEWKVRYAGAPFHRNLGELLAYLDELETLVAKKRPTAKEKARRIDLGWEGK